MDEQQASELIVEQDEWALRSQYWLAQCKDRNKRNRRERQKQALVLCGHGLSIRADKGSLLIRDGNTHHPAERREWRFFKGSLEIPPSILIVDGSGEVTLDAMEWLANQNVPLIRVRWDGQFSSILTSGGQAAKIELVGWQVATRDDPLARARFASSIVREKASATLETMESHVPRSKIWDSAMFGIERRVAALESLAPRSVVDVLGWEAGIASDYFRAWSAIPIKWRVSKRHPIPDSWLKFSSRSAVRARQHSNNRATHPVNAMLNYAYAALTGRTQIQLVAEGYDPTIGIMHDIKVRRGTYPAFALDRMEPMRPVVDRAVLELIATETFSGADFSIQNDGVCRLNPELARRLAQSTLQRLENC